VTGVRLYKETPAEVPPSPSPTKPIRGKEATGTKGKGPKGRGKKSKSLGGSLVSPPAVPSWELLGSSTDELQAVGEELTGSKANAEADIGYQASQILTIFCNKLCYQWVQPVLMMCSTANAEADNPLAVNVAFGHTSCYTG